MLFLFGREIGTVIGKRLVGIFEQLELVLVQVQGLTLVINGFDTLEEAFVETNRGRVLGHLRRKDLLQFLQGLIGLGVCEIIEATRHAGKQVASLVEGDNGVLEGRGFGVIDNSVDIRQTLFHTLLKSRKIVLVLDLVKGISTMRSGPVSTIHERILMTRGQHCCGKSHD